MFGTIWYIMILPVIATIYLMVWHKKKTAWYELVGMWAVCIILIMIGQWAAVRVAVTDTEYWGHLGIKVEHNEPYSKWDTCDRQVRDGETCSGSGKDRTCSPKYRTEYYDCVKNTSRQCFLYDRMKNRHYISYGRYRELAVRWGNDAKFRNMNRKGTIRRFIKRGRPYYTGEGNRYTAEWNKVWTTSEPMVSVHKYENRVAASSSVLNFKQVTEQKKIVYKLYDYPFMYEGGGGYEMVSILSHTKKFPAADTYWRFINGQFGPVKRIRVWILLFEGQEREAALYQKQHWKNGNKNELTLCIGMDRAGKVTWGEVFSWTEQDEMVIRVRNRIEAMEVVSDQSLIKLAMWAEKTAIPKYVKPEFTEKYKHLAVNPPIWIILVVWGVIALANIGLCIYIVRNSLDESH